MLALYHSLMVELWTSGRVAVKATHHHPLTLYAPTLRPCLFLSVLHQCKTLHELMGRLEAASTVISKSSAKITQLIFVLRPLVDAVQASQAGIGFGSSRLVKYNLQSCNLC